LLIDQIKDGLVVVKDGERTFELVAERPERISLIRGKGGKAADTEAASPSDAPRTTTPDVPSRITTAQMPPQLTDERKDMMEELMNKMMAAQTDFESDKTSSQLSPKERLEKMKELLSQFQDTRISDKEAQKLDRLGRQLKDVDQDPNQPPPPGTRRPMPIRRKPQPPKK
jgi:ribosomal protein L16 Arg81 hydroxylase